MSRRPPLFDLSIRNCQRHRAVRTARLRQALQALFRDDLKIAGCTLCIHLVDAPEMTRLNEQFLGHEGSTDVITFDHAEVTDNSPAPPAPPAVARRLARANLTPRVLHGEIFISVPDAVKQARAFRTSWQSEIARYAIHGVLHLLGHEDHAADERRRMKREEGRLLKLFCARCPVKQLTVAPT